MRLLRRRLDRCEGIVVASPSIPEGGAIEWERAQFFIEDSPHAEKRRLILTIRGYATISDVAVSLVLTALTVLGTGPHTLYAQAPGMEAPPSKVEVTIKDRHEGYETVGFTMPSHDTTIVVRNLDTVTHGFASNLFNNIPVRMEGGVEVKGKRFRSFHVDPGKTMTLQFATAPSKFDPLTGGTESLRYALWCDIHPEVTGEVYVIETRGELGGG